MDDVSVRFLGAVETVTGSRILVTYGDTRLLLDCGLFQGIPDVDQLNNAKFPVSESSISAVILTHAHLDHCGYIPALVKNGFSGTIYSSEYTRRISDVVLKDAAHLQMQEAKYDTKKTHSHPDHLILYDEVDVDKALSQFRSLPIHSRSEILPNIFLTLFPAGHILGSTFVLLEIGGKSILFTGDLGRGNHPFLVGPDPLPARKLDALITESTYGNREHETPMTEFARELNAAIARGGSILIPAFAVDRTEEILFELRRLFTEGIVKSLPVYLDSPMAETVLSLYREAFVSQSPEIRPALLAEFAGTDPFEPGKLREMYTADESKSIDQLNEQSIVVSASGMATGGRVTFHLQDMLPDPKNTIIFVGFQSRGTRGLALEQGAAEVKIHGAEVPVRAHVADVESFSVHADQNELSNWMKGAGEPTQVFIVHGERESQEGFAEFLKENLHWSSTIPQLLQEYRL